MDAKAYLENLITFHRWRQERIAALLRTLDPEMLSRQLSGSFGSLNIVLNHLVWAEKVWYARVVPGAVAHMRDQDTEGQLREWAEIATAWQSLVQQTPAADFDKTVVYFSQNGERFENTLFDILVHLVDHSTYHIGQLMNAVRALGMEPVTTNYIHFLRAKNQVSA